MREKSKYISPSVKGAHRFPEALGFRAENTIEKAAFFRKWEMKNCLFMGTLLLRL